MSRITFTRSPTHPTKDTKQLLAQYKAFNKPCVKLYPNARFLTIIACHTNSLVKVRTIINNLKYLVFATNRIVIVNSANTSHSKILRETIEKSPLDIEYKEIPNDSCLDCGKWMHYINNYYKNTHDYVVFTNDSYLIQGSVQHFYNAMYKRGTELYGYNDSTQIRYHYQSYLFGIKNNFIHKFCNHFSRVKKRLKAYMDVVGNIELQLTNIYASSKDCFLKIGNLRGNVDKNVFFNNDALYFQLKSQNLLPFTKLKRIAGDRREKEKIFPVTAKPKPNRTPPVVPMKTPSQPTIVQRTRSSVRSHRSSLRTLVHVNNQSMFII